MPVAPLSNNSIQVPFPSTVGLDTGLSGTSTLTEAEKTEIRRLRATCPLYDAFRWEWDFNLSAYEGGTQFITDQNLFKHSREHDDDFKERLKRAHYMNYCDGLVDFFTDFIFAETIDRNGGTNQAFYDEFIVNVNRKNEGITEFMKEVSSDDQILGMVYVLVDTPKIPEGQKLTKAQEKQLGIRPYWVLIRPQEVLDWVVDEFDKYSYIKRFQIVDEFSGGSKRVYEKYTEWTPTNIIISKIDVTEPAKPRLLPKDIITNKVEEVPLVCIRYKRNKKFKEMGDAFLKDLAMQNREVMNLTSLLQEFLYRQCFNILAVEVDNQLPTKDQAEGDIGTANLLEFPKGAKPPSYIAPESAPADKIHEERGTLINEMYRRAAQDTVNELFNGAKRSGFSQAQSFSNTVPRIASRAETLEKAENRLMELTMKYMSKKWDGRIKYKDRYEITNISDALNQLTQVFKDLQMPSEMFAKSQLKRMVHEIDGKLTTDEMIRIEAEIDAMDFVEWQNTQKLAMIGKASMSPEVGTAFGDKVAAPAPKTIVPGKDKVAAVIRNRKPTTMAEAKAEAIKGK
jgi:hemoglobin-like flavoprotein